MTVGGSATTQELTEVLGRPTSMRRTRSALIAASLLAVAPLVACGTEKSGASDPGPSTTVRTSTTTTTPGRPIALPSLGELPELATDEPDVTITECSLVPERPTQVNIEAVVVNNGSYRAWLQSLSVIVKNEKGEVVADNAKLWGSVEVGAGRRTRLRQPSDLDGVATDVTCEAGELDLRDHGRPDLHHLEALTLDGCTPIEVTVANPFDEPAGVKILVEAFDSEGFSAGTFDLGQWPTDWSTGKKRSALEEPLAAGATGTYSVNPQERIDDHQTPLDGTITSCQVVSSEIEANPEATLVLVD